MAISSDYQINYEDERFEKVEADKSQAMTELDQTYGGMIANSDKYYNDLIESSKDWADKQSQIQQENTDFAIEKIEQQKAQANKDYLKEQSGAYVDWQKQSNQYGAEAEQMASAGLTNTGFSESAQVSMYNTYQIRVATARETYSKAVLNYDNAIKDAQLQNNAALAEIAFQSLQQQLELSLQGFQYKNSLIIEQSNKKTELDNIYYNRYQDVLKQMNTENSIKLDIEKYNDTQKWETEQAEINRKFETEQAELNRKHDKEMLDAKTEKEKELAEENYKREMEKLKKQQEYELAQMDKQLSNSKALAKYEKSLSGGSGTISGGGSSSGSSGSSKIRTSGGGSKVTSGSNAVNTAYYSGALNKDAKKGTFSNGYQPNNINGKKLSKTGESITIKTQTLYGQKQTVVQNVWKTPDGKKWYWEGRQNKYIQIK